LVSISWERGAVKELGKLSPEVGRRVVAAVERLRNRPLAGELLSGEWKGFRRLRVGPCRVIYGYDGARLLVLVVRVGHRGSVYR
jgi:mRNA interferase RelE/StbE